MFTIQVDPNGICLFINSLYNGVPFNDSTKVLARLGNCFFVRFHSPLTKNASKRTGLTPNHSFQHRARRTERALPGREDLIPPLQRRARSLEEVELSP